MIITLRSFVSTHLVSIDSFIRGCCSLRLQLILVFVELYDSTRRDPITFQFDVHGIDVRVPRVRMVQSVVKYIQTYCSAEFNFLLFFIGRRKENTRLYTSSTHS